MKITEYTELCIKELTGNISNDEKKLLDAWLSQSLQNLKEYEKIKTIWSSTKPAPISTLPDIDEEWRALYNRLEGKTKSRIKKSSLNNIYSFIRLKPAFTSILAGTIILVLLTLILTLNKETPFPQLKIKTILTANKELKEIKLPDGSTVILNNASKIEFPEKFNNKLREVKLSGEGFFSVKKNKIPFKVKTDNAVTVVLGTEFNIKARREKTQVIVKEGKVSFESTGKNSQKIFLSKDEASIIVKESNPSEPEKINADYLLGWMKDKLIFNQTSLGEIAEELGRFYGVEVNLKNNDLSKYTLTGSFNRSEIDTVLAIICTALELDYEKSGSKYLIKHRNISN